MTYRFHHVHVICRDLEKMINFFCGVLGAHLIERKKIGTADAAGLDLQGTTISLRLRQEGEEISEVVSQRRYGFDHIGLQVEDLEAAYRDLTSKGFPFPTPPKDVSIGRVAFFTGPENISIELIQPLR